MKIPSQRLSDIVFEEIIVKDDYELRKLSKYEDIKTIIDIGANFGITSIFSRFLFPNSKIIAIEPIPETYKILEDNVKNLNIITINKAFSDGRSLFIKRSNFSAGANQCIENKQDSDKEEILGINLLQIFKNYNINIDEKFVIKIDCEGGEKYLLDNNNIDFITRAELITGEFHFNVQKDFPSKEECLKMIQYLNETHDFSNTKLTEYNASFAALKRGFKWR